MNSLIALICIIFVFTLVSLPHILSVRKHSKKQPQHLNRAKTLKRQDIKEFLRDVTSNDNLTLTALETAFKKFDAIPYHNLADGYEAYEDISYSLMKSNRLIEMDWAEGERAIFDYFDAMFDLDGIEIPDTVEMYLIKKEGEIKRGEAAEFVAALLRDTANKAGYEILHLNAGDDHYRFLLSPQEAAQKWNGAELGKFIKIEIPNWNVASDFAGFEAKKKRREPRSKLVRHLQKQSEKAQFSEDFTRKFKDEKANLLITLEKSNYQEEDTDQFRRAMNGHGFAIALFDMAAKSLGNNYFVKDFDFKAYSLGLYYKMIADRVSGFGNSGLSIVSVPTYVMFSLIGKLSGEKIWSAYANPYIQQILNSPTDNIKKISSQFPLMSFLLEEENLTEKAHDLLSETYKIDTRKDPKLLYDAMIQDRIKNTRLVPDLQVSIYSGAPFCFLPLEILYVSTLIELPLCADLLVLRDKLQELPIEIDEGIIALETYLAKTGK